MGIHDNLLRKQVSAERKRRRIVFYTLVLLSILYVAIHALFSDMGLFRYYELRKTKIRLERQIAEIERENAHLRRELKSLKEDPFVQEKYAREEYGLAKPDELIFQYDR